MKSNGYSVLACGILMTISAIVKKGFTIGLGGLTLIGIVIFSPLYKK